MAKGLLSFMCEEAVTTGAVVTTRAEKEKLAKDSVAWNMKHGGFLKMFPELDGGLDAIAEVGKKGAREGEEGSDAGGWPRRSTRSDWTDDATIESLIS